MKEFFDEKIQSLTFWMSEIVQIRYLLSRNSVSLDAAEVLFTYFECECLYKKLLWPIAKSKHPDWERDNLKIHLNQVSKILFEYGIDADKDLLSRVFGSNNDNLSTCSIKALKDCFVHNCTGSLIQAIIERKDEIVRDLNSFLSLFDLRE